MDSAHCGNVFMILVKTAINLVHKYSYVWCIVGLWTAEIETEGTVPKTYIAKAKIAIRFFGMESTLHILRIE